MDKGSCFLKEYRVTDSQGKSFVFQVNFAGGDDLNAVLNKLVLFGSEVHNEDWTRDVIAKSETTSYASAKLTQYLSEGCDIFTVTHLDNIIGVYVLQFVFDSICAVRAVYIDEDYRAFKIMKFSWDELIANGIKVFLFQTSKKIEPKGLASNKLKQKVSEDELSITWKMEV